MVVGKHAVQSKGVGRTFGNTGALPECKVKTLLTPDHTAFLVRCSGYGQAGICPSSRDGPNS